MPTYNIVAEGADNNGNTPIDGVLDVIAEENTTIIFPSGKYKLNELVVQSGVDDLKLIAPNGARLIPGQSGDSIRWIDVYSQGFVMDGFELDMRNTPVPPFVRMNYESGDWELKRLVTRGKVRAATDSNVRSGDSSEARTYFRLSAAEGTRGLLQDCYFHEGACEPDEASNRRAVLVESGKGELVFNRCWFELWAENTMYAKNLEGPMKVYNCFQRNTQNGMRLGGNTEVRNCVSIKDDKHPIQAWSGGALQRGVNAEGSVPTDSSRGVSSYKGTITIADSDFYHRYPEPTCGGPITGPTPVARIDVQNVRISYKSEKSHDAIYTLPGRMNDGDVANLEYLRLRNIHVDNDHPYTYAVSIDQEPDEWGKVSGVLGGSGRQTDSSYVRNRVTTDGDPTPPNTQPPLPDPPELGQVPLQSAQLIKIDNRGNDSEASYLIKAGTNVLPAGDDNATISMKWGPNNSPVRPPNSELATGEVPPGEVHAFYVTGGIEKTTGGGSATWSADGAQFNPGVPITTETLSLSQPNTDTWHQVDQNLRPIGVTIAKPLSYRGTQPAHVRWRNSDDGDFEYKIEEWLYQDGSHIKETFHLLSVSPGSHLLEQDNGTSYRMKAGTVSTSDRFNDVSLGGFFGSEQPIVLTQSQSYNGSEPVVTRIQDRTNDSFSVQVQESETPRGGHALETVGYIALQQGTGHLNGQPFEVRQTTQSVDEDWFYIQFEQEYETPRFCADLQTYHGFDPAVLRYRNLTGTGVEVKVEEAESEDKEVKHATEVIGYTVFEGATLATNKRTNDQLTNGSWHEVDSNIQSSRVVIAKPLSYNGHEPAHIRLQESSSSGYEYRIEEWKHLDGGHNTETFYTIASEPGNHELLLSDGTHYRAKVGTLSASDNFETCSLENFFEQKRPIVFAQSQTYVGSNPIVTRIKDVTENSFDVKVQEAEVRSDGHRFEKVGYIALEEISGELNGSSFEVQRTEELITEEWFKIQFENEYESPKFIADSQTYNGNNTSNLRYRNLTNSSVEIKVEEEESKDSETRHQLGEVVGYAVFEGK